MIIIVEKSHVNHKRKWLVALVGLLIFMSVPITAIANPAITSFIMDRTAITQGESVTFNLRTTDNVNYVFSDVNGIRVQGTRQGTDSWQLVVSPNATQNVTIVANTTNTINNAAMVSIPIIVNAVAAIPAPPMGTVQGSPPITLPPVTAGNQQQQTQQGSPQVTLPPVGGEFTIHSITEVSAGRTGYVQLNVVVSSNANEVWVQFDQDRFRRGQENVQARTDTTRTFEVIFRPRAWAVQTVRVSANREYVTPGATTQNFTLALVQPPAQIGNPTITNAQANNRTVALGSNTTVTITTNQYANYVWLTDVAGTRHNATISSQTPTRITWSVTFAPQQSGTARVYASSIDSTTGAATRTMQFTVQHPTALIDNATATSDVTWNPWAGAWTQGNLRISVTTNLITERVWVNLPDGRQQQLTLQTTGATTRTWATYVTINWSWGHNWDTVSVHASSTQQQVSEASRTVTITGRQHGDTSGEYWSGSSAHLEANTWVSSAHIRLNAADDSVAEIRVYTAPHQNLASVTALVPWSGHHVPLTRTSNYSHVWTASVDVSAWLGPTGWNTWWWGVSISGTRFDGWNMPTVGGTWHHW